MRLLLSLLFPGAVLSACLPLLLVSFALLVPPWWRAAVGEARR